MLGTDVQGLDARRVDHRHAGQLLESGAQAGGQRVVGDIVSERIEPNFFGAEQGVGHLGGPVSLRMRMPAIGTELASSSAQAPRLRRKSIDPANSAAVRLSGFGTQGAVRRSSQRRVEPFDGKGRRGCRPRRPSADHEGIEYAVSHGPLLCPVVHALDSLPDKVADRQRPVGRGPWQVFAQIASLQMRHAGSADLLRCGFRVYAAAGLGLVLVPSAGPESLQGRVGESLSPGRARKQWLQW